MKTKFDQSNLVKWRKYALLIIMLSIFCTYCIKQKEISPPSYSPTPEQRIMSTPSSIEASATALPILIVSVTNTVTTGSAIRCNEFSEGIYQITEKAVSWLLWANTDAHLYYRLKDSDEYWQLDLNDRIVVPISKEELTVMTENPLTISMAIPDAVPEHHRSVAPSGNRAIFVEEQFLGPTPTPGEGEGEGMNVHYDFFTLENKSLTPVHLGRIDGSVDGFQWLPNEQEVLISTNPRQPGTASLWLVNLDKRELRPLFIVEEGKDEALFKALSPGGDLILYEQSSGLYLYNRKTSTTKNVIVPAISGRAYYWFLSEDQLLIVDDFDQPLDFKVAVYDLQSEQLHQMSDQTLQIHSIELSPDHNYLAIRRAETLALYIFPVCYEHN